MIISRNYLDRLLKVLENNFTCKQYETNETIYFENNYEDNLCLMLGKFILSKGIQSTNKISVTAIKIKEDVQYTRLCKSMGVIPFFLQQNILFYEKVLSIIITIWFCLFINSGNKLIKLRIKGIHIGDLVYDHIIRCNKNRKYTLNKLQTIEEINFLYEAILWVMVYSRKFKKQPPKYFVAGDIIYLNGILVRLAQKSGAEIIEYCTGKNFYLISNGKKDFSPNYHACVKERVKKYMDMYMTTEWEKEVDAHIEDLFKGKGDWNTQAAYGNKKVVKKDELLKQIGINNNKKNVVIMAHCFSDSPHCGGAFIYKDYYEWLVCTLGIVKDLDNVNWILKPHPCRSIYKEKGVVEALFSSYKSGNLYWMPDEFSASMIPIFADAIVTVGGTGGIEYSCCGIPCINAGTTFYTYFNITKCVTSKLEYLKVLKNMHKIKKLGEERVHMAKKVLYAYWKISDFNKDALQVLNNNSYYDFRKDYKIMKNNNSYVESLEEWTIDNCILDSYVYQYGENL